MQELHPSGPAKPAEKSPCCSQGSPCPCAQVSCSHVPTHAPCPLHQQSSPSLAQLLSYPLSLPFSLLHRDTRGFVGHNLTAESSTSTETLQGPAPSVYFFLPQPVWRTRSLKYSAQQGTGRQEEVPPRRGGTPRYWLETPTRREARCVSQMPRCHGVEDGIESSDAAVGKQS